MKNTILLILSMILSLNIFASELSLSKEEQLYLQNLDSIKVAVQDDWVPYNFVEDQSVKGYSNDYIKIIAKILNKKIDFVQGHTWKESLEMLKNQQIDAISNMVITKKRKEDFLFTNHSTFSTYKSLFSNNLEKYLSIEELNNKTVGVVQGYYEQELLEKHYPKIKIKTYASNTELISSLLNHNVNAVIANATVLNYILQEKFITDVHSSRLINEYFPLQGVRIAFDKESQILKSIFDKAMLQIDKQEINQLKQKWSFKQIAQNTLTTQEKSYLKNNKFTLYFNNNGWVPFIFTETENDIPKGISVDIWSEITKNTNIQVTYTPIENFTQILKLVKENVNTIVGATSKVKERESYASFTKPYASFPVAIATNVKEKFLLDLKELEGKTVAVGKNYTAHLLLKKYYPNMNFVPVKNIQTALDMLANGKVYAAADILPVINYELNKYSFTNLKISGTSNFNFDVSIMVNKANEPLIPILNKLIDNIDETKKEEIINKWVHRNYKRVDYTIAYVISIIALIIFAFILYRQNILKKQNKQIEIEVKKATYKLQELNKVHEDTQHLAKIATSKKNIKTGEYLVSKEFYNIFEFEADTKISTEKIIEKVDQDDKKKFKDFLKYKEQYRGDEFNTGTLFIKILLNNKKIKYLELYISYNFDENKQPIDRKVTIQDITEKTLSKQEKEKQDALLVQQSKLASMGEMIGAIAHQWRQPLNELSIRIQKLKYAYAKEQINEEFIRDFIQKNKNTIDFMSKTIDDFRNFFRIDKDKRKFHIKDALEEVINIQSAQLKNHHIILQLEGEDFIFDGYKTEFQQVVMNLISNSKDAIVSKGIEKPAIHITLKKNKIEFADNGGGIDNAILKRVFEPYFTTKEQGEGTGMGLYMSKMIIEDNMNGKLKIENKKDGILITIDFEKLQLP